MTAICRGVTLASRAILAVHPDNAIVHADGADVYSTDEPAFRTERDFRQALVFLPLDMLFGCVDERHALRPWLVAKGIDAEQLDWQVENMTPPDIVG